MIMTSESQKAEIITLPTDVEFLNFFGEENHIVSTILNLWFRFDELNQGFILSY